mmetsp:Transcript_22575/g.34726  ORF Transcript_22575/g.34726 Transcript_22575/m.34726 type:complete len:120 (+) Transcript_22575:1129-1488(+)
MSDDCFNIRLLSPIDFIEACRFNLTTFSPFIAFSNWSSSIFFNRRRVERLATASNSSSPRRLLTLEVIDPSNELRLSVLACRGAVVFMLDYWAVFRRRNGPNLALPPVLVTDGRTFLQR